MDTLIDALHAIGLPVAGATVGAGIIMLIAFVGPRILHTLGMSNAAEERADDETRMRANMENDIHRLREEIADNRQRLDQCEESHEQCRAQLEAMRKRVSKLENKRPKP